MSSLLAVSRCAPSAPKMHSSSLRQSPSMPHHHSPTPVVARREFANLSHPRQDRPRQFQASVHIRPPERSYSKTKDDARVKADFKDMPAVATQKLKPASIQNSSHELTDESISKMLYEQGLNHRAFAQQKQRDRRGYAEIEAFQQAFVCFSKAAQKGHVPAMHALAWCYHNRDGIQMDEGEARKEALKWFLKAAERGDSKAMHHVGYCYKDGIGTPENATEANRWFRKAKWYGDTTALWDQDDPTMSIVKDPYILLTASLPVKWDQLLAQFKEDPNLIKVWIHDKELHERTLNDLKKRSQVRATLADMIEHYIKNIPNSKTSENQLKTARELLKSVKPPSRKV